MGISFYTFTQIAYLVDCWRGRADEARFVHYLLFVTYFPHLIAGPVLHHAQMMPQFADASTYRPDPAKLVLGLTTFTLGLGKKLLVAGPLGACADVVFEVAGGAAGGHAGHAAFLRRPHAHRPLLRGGLRLSVERELDNRLQEAGRCKQARSLPARTARTNDPPRVQPPAGPNRNGRLITGVLTWWRTRSARRVDTERVYPPSNPAATRCA